MSNSKNLSLDKKNIDTVLVLDFGSQYTQLIARRVRELGVYCEIYHHKSSIKSIKDFDPKGIILSGGPETVKQKGSPKVPDQLFNLGIPVLGICYGMQTLAEQMGGQVISADHKEFGHAEINITIATGTPSLIQLKKSISI